MLYLHEIVSQGQQSTILSLADRLPAFIKGPCDVTVNYEVEAKENFYLLHLHVQGTLCIACQRCLDEFSYSYDNMTILAICRDDAQAEQLLARYECIVAPNLQIDLYELVVDELYLYAPQIHSEIAKCNSEINQFLMGKSEPY